MYIRAAWQSKYSTFFATIEIPTISDQDKANREQSLSTVEIEQAIKQMKSGKAPGPDGFII